MQEKCNSCGADIEYSPGTQSLKCPYCGADNAIRKPENALPDGAAKIIPLSVDRTALDNQVYRYMATGDFTPDDMLEIATITRREISYVPAYDFTVNYEAVWTASFGFDRKEPYTAYRTVFRNNRSHQEAYTAYRTVTDWRPANGNDAGIFTVATYAGKFLHESNLTPALLVPKIIKAGGATDYDASFAQGIDTEAFAVSETASYASLEEEVNANIDAGVKHHRQGDHNKDWRWKAQMSHKGLTCYVPICHAVFAYEGKEYHFWIGGNGSKEFFATDLPEDKNKKKTVTMGFIPMWAAFAGLVFSTMVWEFTWTSVITTAVAFGYGALRNNALVGHSKKIRASLLTQMEASSDAIQNLNERERAQRASAFQKPKRPFFAKTHNDKLALPCLSIVAFLVIAVTSYLSQPGLHTSPAATTPSQVVSHPDVPHVNTAAAQNTPPAQKLALSPTLNAIVQAAGKSDWKTVDVLMANLKQHLPLAVKGNAKLAHAAEEEGMKALQRGDDKAAVAAYTRAVHADASDIDARDTLGVAYMQSRDFKKTLQVLTDALMIVPDKPQSWAYAATAFGGAGQLDDATACLRLTLRYGHRQKIINYFNMSIENEKDPQYHAILVQVLNEADSIPQTHFDDEDSAAPATASETVPTPQAAPAPVAPIAPSPAQQEHAAATKPPAPPAAKQANTAHVNAPASAVAPQQTPAAPSTSDNSGAQVDALYGQAISAMRHGQYDHAIELVDSGLAIAPGDTRLRDLKNTLVKTKQSVPGH